MEEKNWNDEWVGLEPEQPQSGRCGCWLGAMVLLIALFATCLGTAYFAWQQLNLPIDPGAVLAPPIVPPLASLSPIDGVVVGTPEIDLVATQPALVATVTLPSGGGTEAEPRPGADKEAGEARLFASVPQIDGNLNEWANIPDYESLYRVYNVAGWDGTDDVRAIWRLGWDQNNLYAAVQVKDDVHVQTQRGNTIFKGDGVSLQLDTELEADYGSRLSPDDYQINLSPGDFAGNPAGAYLFRGDNSGNLVDMSGHHAQIGAQPTGNGYSVEAAIPWSDLGISPQDGLQIGIALNVNDNDSPGTAVQEVMKSHVETRLFSDPSSWGVIVLR